MGRLISSQYTETALAGASCLAADHWAREMEHRENLRRGRIATSGKFLRCGEEKWFVKGLTYGPFPKSAEGHFLPDHARVRKDFRHIASLGGNCVRLYHAPPRWLLDEAIEQGLRTFVDVPWEKHRCFFEDFSAQEDARRRVRKVARDLADHPGLFAISVANEFPVDIVRYYGHRRVERFIEELIDVAKQSAPQCLATFANYPTTEFLNPRHRDFVCFNVYLDSEPALAAYLDRLQHLAGPLPVILGEYGTDSYRHGEQAQAESLRRHISTVLGHGLAGSFIFSYTDEWFTGGHLVEDWAFGITRSDRSEKHAAAMLKRQWSSPLRIASGNAAPLPMVSVVVCSYNGGATLRECLQSLETIDYPDYEVILVDDGSTDNTQQIAADFPWVRNIRQANKGLSAARNIGAEAAVGSIVAYTDSDCVADPDWLYHLVTAMQRLQVGAIGGPNLPPPSDSWMAQCVAVSPGGPSHVMLDDHLAEHVPGCNMAFDRELLLKVGGFDAQFRQAGDDVDICWRLLDAGERIGFAAGAMVWHHRRNSVKAYLKQQKGYGRSEAMLAFKHAPRFNRLGCSRWRGIILRRRRRWPADPEAADLSRPARAGPFPDHLCPPAIQFLGIHHAVGVACVGAVQPCAGDHGPDVGDRQRRNVDAHAGRRVARDA
jgi:GT2 family glycosyltransferase